MKYITTKPLALNIISLCSVAECIVTILVSAQHMNLMFLTVKVIVIKTLICCIMNCVLVVHNRNWLENFKNHTFKKLSYPLLILYEKPSYYYSVLFNICEQLANKLVCKCFKKFWCL